MTDLLLCHPPRKKITIMDLKANRPVQASIGRLTSRWARRLITNQWWRGLPVPLVISSDEGDHAWAWEKLAGPIENDPIYGAYVALTANNRQLTAEGAIIYRLDALSLLDPNEGAANLLFLASAPRNRCLLVGEDARYQGVGESLVAIAIMDSIYNGFGGRVLCEPLEKAIPFYEKLNFVRALDRQTNRTYYEIPCEKALACVKARGWV